MVLTFNDKEEKAVKQIIAALADSIQFEVKQPPLSPVLSFPGLEISQHQCRVLQDGTDIYLTRLEYGTLVYLASYPAWYFRRNKSFKQSGAWIVIAASPVW